MKCPIDDTALVMSERSGIEIDYCPQCRGVWLDRGELDKIIERAGPGAGTGPVARSGDEYREPRYEPEQRPRYDSDQRGRYDSDHRPRKKRDSFLGEIFDF